MSVLEVRVRKLEKEVRFLREVFLKTPEKQKPDLRSDDLEALGLVEAFVESAPPGNYTAGDISEVALKDETQTGRRRVGRCMRYLGFEPRKLNDRRLFVIPPKDETDELGL